VHGPPLLLRRARGKPYHNSVLINGIKVCTASWSLTSEARQVSDLQTRSLKLFKVSDL
jgi:hypothetical protein